MRVIPALILLAACGPENTLVDRVFHVEGSWTIPDAFYEEPELPRFYTLDIPYGPSVADDGTVLLFDWETGGDVYGFHEATGLGWITNTGAYYNTAQAISGDGTRVLGSYGRYDAGEDTQAAIWTEAGGWIKLGALPDALDCPMQSSGWSLSGDGTVAVGLAFEGCSAFAFRWDATNGMVPLEQVGDGGNRATKVSRDGSLAVGFAQGDASRTPAMWFDDGTGQVLDMRFGGEFYDVNADGTMAVGNLGSKAMKWTEQDGHTLLGTLGTPGQSSSKALTVCGPDELILGTDSLAGGVATAWTEESGLVQLTDLFAENDLELPATIRLRNVLACSHDGRVITGQGGDTESEGTWIAVFPDGLR